MLLTRVKQILARICSSLDISVLLRNCASFSLLLIRLDKQVVITNQMATKLLTPDGFPASFDTGSRAVLVPQLGKSAHPMFPKRTDRLTYLSRRYLSSTQPDISCVDCPGDEDNRVRFFFLHAEVPKENIYLFSGCCVCFRIPVLTVRVGS
jgi:hypothetical protein